MEKKIIEFIADELGIKDIASITRESDLITDLGATSLDVVEIICGIEDAYNIIIPDDQGDKLRKVGDLIDYMEKHKDD